MGSAAVGGARVAELRTAHGITQAALAHRAGITVKLLSKIELGDRRLTPGVAAVIARALQMSLGALYGQAEITPDQSMQLEDLRIALRRYDLPGQAPVPDPAQLRVEVDQAITLRDQARLAELLQTLPGLLTRATTHAHTVASPQGWALLAEVYSLTYHLAAQHRWMDLVEIAPARQAQAADHQPDPLVNALAACSRAGAFLHYGDFEGGLTVVDRAIVTAQGALTGAEKAFATGVLHLRGMVLAGRQGDRSEAERFTEAAWRCAEEFPADVRRHDQRFGPAATAATVLVTEADLGRPREVIRLAGELTSTPSGLPPTRMADVHISTACAHLDLGERDSAQTSLERAWQAAPEKARIHPMSRDALRVLVSLHRRSNPQLLTLAKQAGLTA
jgi:transcriptional regulator with XRE-family HTH domain